MFSSLTPQRKEFFGLLATPFRSRGGWHQCEASLDSRNRPSNPGAMASLAADACLRLNRAVITLADPSREQESLIEFCLEVGLIEGVAAQAMREALPRLFEHEGDESAAWHAMKMRGFHFTQEEVLRGCKRAAKTIEEILIENS